ncbi:iron-hydroxamate transporter permease subunit [Raoultella ornithinolytica]|nr:iron-hydroxamate transporter permease subunit [Raoultella ornithinolytica]
MTSGRPLIAAAGAALLFGGVMLLATSGRGGATPLRITLCGVALSAFASAVTAAILILDEQTLLAMRTWLAGDLAGLKLASFTIGDASGAGRWPARAAYRASPERSGAGRQGGAGAGSEHSSDPTAGAGCYCATVRCGSGGRRADRFLSDWWCHTLFVA